MLVISGIKKTQLNGSSPPSSSSCPTLLPQQGRKGSFCPLSWFPTSSRIIVTNNPWLRLVLTMTTTALILVMAVLNMVRKTSPCEFSRSSGRSKSAFFFFFGVFQFFVEDPGGTDGVVLTTSPPEVLISAPPLNLTNDSVFGFREENAAEIKFYLPVSSTMTQR